MECRIERLTYKEHLAFPSFSKSPSMQTALLKSQVDVSPQAVPHCDIAELVETCIEQTAEALLHTRSASRGDVAHAVATVRRAHAQGQPDDLMAAIARMQLDDGQGLAEAVGILGERLAATLNPAPQMIPFAGRLIAPSTFYDSFDRLHQLARALLAPVIFAEETASIGVGSPNPIAAALLAGKIQELVSRRFDIRPFMTIARIDYETWTLLTHRHFEL